MRMDFDPLRDYPLGRKRPDLVGTPGGLGLDELTLEALREGRLSSDEIRATPETLVRQSQVAAAVGRVQLAESLARASELSAVPAELSLEVYAALRPGRSTGAELDAWANRLESEYGARETAAFIREARDVYSSRGLLASDGEQPTV